MTSTPVSVSHWLLVSLPAVQLMIHYLLFRLSKDEHCVSLGLVQYTKTQKTADVTVIQKFPAEKAGFSHTLLYSKHVNRKLTVGKQKG